MTVKYFVVIAGDGSQVRNEKIVNAVRGVISGTCGSRAC
jgi:hypothetical protein